MGVNFGAVVDPKTRERRLKIAAQRARRRLWVSLVLAGLIHLLAVPLAVVSFRYEAPPAPEVSLVRIPAAAWDAARAGAPPPEGAERAPAEEKERRAKERKKPKEEEKAKPEPPPGQVVEVAPGNKEKPDDAAFAAESDNRVERETISRDRRAGAKVTTPKATAPSTEVGGGAERVAEGAEALGVEGGDEQALGPQEEAGSKLEIPSIEKRGEISLQEAPDGVGSVQNRSGSDEVRGNSDRFRVQVGEGEGDADQQAGGLGPQGGQELRLFPSASVVDRIVGAPAPDHVEGVAEDEGTFLNTREWRFASFMNRMKKGVSIAWDPNGVARTRDPSGKIYFWKDRYTIVSVTLRADGSLADIFVDQSSGVDFLDREAIAAFERAQPFPHPPKGMIDEQGQIQFKFGFFIDTSRVGLRIFR